MAMEDYELEELCDLLTTFSDRAEIEFWENEKTMPDEVYRYVLYTNSLAFWRAFDVRTGRQEVTSLTDKDIDGLLRAKEFIGSYL